MKSKFLTIGVLVSLVMFGWGMWEFARNKRELILERRKPIDNAAEYHEVEQAQKKLSDSLLLAKIGMIAGFSGIFISIYYLNKKENTEARKKIADRGWHKNHSS